MRLPGTRYQEHGWEQVRKLLGQCSLQALPHCDPIPAADAGLAQYVDLVAEALHGAVLSARGAASGNSYGDTVAELALMLVYELQERPGDWAALCAACGGQPRLAPGGEALLRKKFNDMYAGLRDKVDADNYQAACGRPCSANRMYAYRMLDTAYGEIARLFAAWQQHAEQVAQILDREPGAAPIEARQLATIGACKPEWVIRWSASLERFGAGPGPLHTRSKRFASLKNNPGQIGEMLREIGEYEALSSNRDQDWLHDASEAAGWIDDYWRVLAESEEAATPGPDQLLEARQEAADFAASDDADAPAAAAQDDDEPDPAPAFSLPPRYLPLAAAAQDADSWTARMLAGDSLPVRLAVYLKLLGQTDDSYPSEWLDPKTGLLPTMQQLAGLDGLSLPTLRKRRDAAIARLGEATRP